MQLAKMDSLGRMGYNVQDTAYRTHDAIEVRIRDMGKIGAVIDTALAYRITDISGVQFQATEVSAARDDALKEATADAQRQAESIAAASGMRLGRVLSFSTYKEESRYDELSLSDVTMTGMAGGASTEIIPRAMPITMTVYGRWALVPRE